MRRAALVTLASVASACCPRLPGPGFPVPPPPPEPTGASTSAGPAPAPPPIVTRYQQAASSTTPPAEPIDRETLKEPPVGLPGPKLDEVRVPRESLAPPVAPAPADTLPDEVVVRLLETGRAAFVRCFKKAVAADPTELSFKVRLHVELDAAGAITAAHTDAGNKTLDACLTRAARWLAFPATGNRVVVDLPLFYRE